MAVGRWYLRQGQTLRRLGRFKAVIDKYQTTSHTPEALYRLVEAYLTLGLAEEAKRNGRCSGSTSRATPGTRRVRPADGPRTAADGRA
jgi:outer membrane protein assembly factor BamD